ncbi:hypothetical protein SLA2020_324210 [Shorea laevis]
MVLNIKVNLVISKLGLVSHVLYPLHMLSVLPSCFHCMTKTIRFPLLRSFSSANCLHPYCCVSSFLSLGQIENQRLN